MIAKPELWPCPRCGRSFANRNQTHSCGHWSVAAFLAGKDAAAKTLYRRFAELACSVGRVTIAPAKTRVGFQARMIFAAVNRLGPGGLAAHVVLARRLEHARFHRIDSIAPKTHVHHFRVSSTEQLDAEVLAWLSEAYEVGEQRHTEAVPSRRPT
jgi:hypothetical protein